MRAPRWHRGLAWGLLVWLAAASSANASTEGAADRTQAARQLFQRGAEHYRIGRYRTALDLFESSLAAARRPNTIFNIAQCHRLLEEPEQALRFYRLYLSESDRNGAPVPHRAEVMGHISKLEADLAARDGAQRPAGPLVDPLAGHTATSAPATVFEQPPELVASSATAPKQAAPPSTTRPFYKTWWFWSAVAVAVGGSIAVTVAATTGGDDRVAQGPDGRFTPATF